MSPGSPDHENTSDTRVASGTRCRDYDGEIDMFLSLWWINKLLQNNSYSSVCHVTQKYSFIVADWSQIFVTLLFSCFYAVICSQSFY